MEAVNNAPMGNLIVELPPDPKDSGDRAKQSKGGAAAA
jgi:hypothetical protein